MSGRPPRGGSGAPPIKIRVRPLPSSSSAATTSTTKKKKKKVAAGTKRSKQSLSSSSGGLNPTTTTKKEKVVSNKSSSVPRILRTVPPASSVSSTVDQQDDAHSNNDADDDDDEFGPFPGLPSADSAAAANDDLLPCDALLALRSLIQRGACGYCPLVHASDLGVPFALRPMLHDALRSTTRVTERHDDDNYNGGGSSSYGGGGGFFGGGGYGNANAAARAAATSAAREAAEISNRIADAESSTTVSIEIESLRRTNRVRLVQLLGTGRGGSGGGGDDDDDVAVMETTDYARGAYDALLDSSSSSSSAAHSATLDSGSNNAFAAAVASSKTADEHEERRRIASWYVSDVLRRCTGRYVDEDEVRTVLFDAQRRQQQGRRRQRRRGEDDSPPPSCDTRSVLDVLVRSGILLPRRSLAATASSSSSSSERYWITLPGMGRAARLLESGRAAVRTKLKRSLHGELKRSELEKVSHGGERHRRRNNNLGGPTALPGAFLFRDLLARGDVQVWESPSGEQFVRLAND